VRGCYSVEVDWSDVVEELALVEYAVWSGG
jgi:hypothetical protein